MTSHTWERPPFSVSTDPARLDLGVIHGFLRGSYWAKGISREVMARSIEHSLCFGAYRERAQVGFARIISDLTTFAYLSDLFVLEPWRGHGLSKFMMECIKSHPQLQGLRRWMLATADAHGLYEQYGFQVIARPEWMMEIVDLDIYVRGTDSPRSRIT